MHWYAQASGGIFGFPWLLPLDTDQLLKLVQNFGQVRLIGHHLIDVFYTPGISSITALALQQITPSVCATMSATVNCFAAAVQLIVRPEQCQDHLRVLQLFPLRLNHTLSR